MFRFHRTAVAVVLVVATAALLTPAAQARPTVSGAAGGGGAVVIDRHAHDTPLPNPVTAPATPPAGIRTARQGGGGTDWNAFFAGAAGSALVIAMFAGGLGLVRRRTLAA